MSISDAISDVPQCKHVVFVQPAKEIELLCYKESAKACVTGFATSSHCGKSKGTSSERAWWCVVALLHVYHACLMCAPVTSCLISRWAY